MRYLWSIPYVAVLVLALAIAACSDSSSSGGGNRDASGGGGGKPANEALSQGKIYDGTIPAADGETIGISVYQPALAAGEIAPLILHGHGFGLSRIKNLGGNDPIENFMHADTSGEAALAAWNDGYYVISFDQRGFGDSSGNVTLMDPDIDGRNISTIIDWAVANLSNLEFDGPSDPRLGAVGLSYGGGYQTIGSAVDDRFDALVPTATWHHLPYSLAPFGIPKVIWLDILVGLGGPTSQFRFDQEVIAGMIQAQTGSVPQSLVDRLAGNSAKSFCDGTRTDGRGPSTTPAFFIQGSQDVLFNFNEAAWNYECWEQHSSDARLLVQRDGHIVPLLQTSGEQILFGGDEQVNCGGELYSPLQMTLDFLNHHLRNEAMVQGIPEVCVAQGTDVGASFSGVPRGGVSYAIPETAVVPGVAGHLANHLLNLDPVAALSLLSQISLLDAPDVLSSLLSGAAQDPTSAFSQAIPDIINLIPSDVLNFIVAAPSFVSLEIASADGAILGIPQIDLSVDGGGAPQSLFFGIGVKDAQGTIRLVDDQVLPLPVSGQYELPGLAEPVADGETIGLVIFPFHSYYLNNSLLGVGAPITVSGSVELPFSVLN